MYTEKRQRPEPSPSTFIGNGPPVRARSGGDAVISPMTRRSSGRQFYVKLCVLRVLVVNMVAPYGISRSCVLENCRRYRL
jgi:hypothetical protein